jgi:predicted Zn-dependent protease
MILAFRKFLPIIFLLNFISCTTAPTGRKQLTLMPDSQMNSLGSQSFSEMKSKTPIEKDPKINAYVRCVANAIIEQAQDSTGVHEWEIVVFKENTINAFALPGGKIGVYTGILPVAKTPDQLAAVLGHEVGHVIARHGNERVSQGMLAQGALAIAQSKGASTATMAALGLGAQFGVILPFSRAHESEADKIGLELMSNAGFNPREAVELWKNMSAATGGKQPPQWMSTHPSHETRIKDLESSLSWALPIYEKTKSRRPNCTL